ncbi:pantetheine-phosphate adenylyltransferase [bacterium]
MKKIAIYPGSFDPITFGHIDIIKRALAIFPEVVVAIVNNPNKKTLFTVAEREEMLQKVLDDFGRIKIESFDGLLVDFLTRYGSHLVIRGLRAISDLEYEFQMAHTNRQLMPDLETIFLMPSEEYTYLSSSVVKEVARLKGDTRHFVPGEVCEVLKKKFLK